MVRLPDAAGQVRNAPLKVIRGLFAGIGQLLVAADRFRAEEAERERADGDEHDPLAAADGHRGASQTPGEVAGEPRQATGQQAVAEPAGEVRTRFRSLDSTGNVRVLTADEAAAESVPAQRARPGPAARAAAARAAAARAAAPRAAAAPAADGLPVPGYDGLSLASLRSRLRVLDAAQLRVLADYERAHAGRQDVVTMFERRIAKLEAAAADAS